MLEPPPTGDAGAWAEANLELPEGSPEPGPYRLSRVPYMRDLFAAYADPRVTDVDMLTASQMTKTTAILALMGHRIDWGPRVPMLYVSPTQDTAKSVSEERFATMVREVPALDALHEKGRRDRVAEKFFAGLRVGFAWAGSKAQLASRPAGLALVDELGRMVLDVEGEGSPLILVRARGKNYPDFRLGTFSTPTIEDADPAQSRFDLGSRQIWCFDCLHCGAPFIPWLRHLVYDTEKGIDPGAAAELAERTARLACPTCGAEHRDADKPRLEATGAYHRTRRDPRTGDYELDPDPPPLGAHRSFWCLGLASPWMTISKLARRLAAAYATHEPETVQGTINVDGGELYRTAGEVPELAEVEALRTLEPAGEVPEWVQGITAGMDPRLDALDYVVRGWGAGLTSHLLEHGTIEGETNYDTVWLWAARLLDRRWRGLPIVYLGVDSGWRPGDRYRRPEHMVYAFAKRHPGRVFPTKGHDTHSPPQHTVRLESAGVPLVHLDSDHWKSWVHSRVRWPMDAESGRWTFHRDATEDYVAQLIGEHVETRSSGRRRWVPRRGYRNHFLDCEAIAVAMAFKANLDLLTPPPPPDPPGRARAPELPPGDPSLERRALS